MRPGAMKLRRRLVTAGLAVSLLLCVGCAAMWVRSHWAFDAWSRGDAQGRTEVGVISTRGRMMAWRVTAAPPDAPLVQLAHKPQPGFRHIVRRPVDMDRFWLGPPQTSLNRAGFGQYSRPVFGAYWQCLFLPWWALCVLTALPMAAWLRWRFQRRATAPAAADAAPIEPRTAG
jgi:hypothetical protein